MALESLRLSVALLLPWLVGGLWARAVLAGRAPSNLAVIVGYGFPIGMALVIGIMLVWDTLGLAQSFWRSCAVLALLGAVPLLLSGGPLPRLKVAMPRLPKAPATAMQYICLLLLVLVVLRFGGFFLEVIWRPVFPWDAWFYYAPRVRVWLEHGALITFLLPSEWMLAEQLAYTAGSGRHPDGIPLIQLWVLQGLGRFDDALMNLPWVAAGVAACCALYGLLRAAGAAPAVGIGAVYILVSLPMFGTHVALAGYGELWVSLYLLLAAGGLYFGLRDRNWRPLVLVLPALAGMLMIKESAPLWLAPLFAGLLFGAVRLRYALLAAALLGLGGLVVLYLLDVEFAVGNLGTFAIGPGGIRLPDYEPVVVPLAGHLFAMANWHLLWFVAPFALLGAVVVSRRHRAVRGLTVTVLSGLGLLLALFVFTQASRWVADGTSVNRILLHLVPMVILLGGIVGAHLFERWRVPGDGAR